MPQPSSSETAPYTRELACAVDAVLDAGRLCRAVRGALVTEDTLAKKDRSPVTVADFGAQALVSLALAEHLPDIPMMGEEDAAALRQASAAPLRGSVVEHVRGSVPAASEGDVLDAIDRCAHPGGPEGRFWVLDPIDGTKGFLRNEQYAVALALVEDGEVVVGVLGAPNFPLRGTTGALFAAVRGAGAFERTLDDKTTEAVHVSTLGEVAEARFCESVESAHTAQDTAACIAATLGITKEPHRIDSQCKYAAVARGDADIYLRLPTRADYEEKLWDHAAGWLLVQEAGGLVTDTRGVPLDFTRGRTLKANRGVVVTNGRFHQEVVEAVRAAV